MNKSHHNKETDSPNRISIMISGRNEKNQRITSQIDFEYKKREFFSSKLGYARGHKAFPTDMIGCKVMH